MKIRLILLVMILWSNILFAQNQNERLNKIIDKALTINQKVFLSDQYKGKGFVFFIGIGVTSKGKVDTVIFSKGISPQLTPFLDVGLAKSKIKANMKEFSSYKNQFIVIPVLLRRGDSDYINNAELLDGMWLNLYKDFEKVRGKKALMLYGPFLMVYGSKVVTN